MQENSICITMPLLTHIAKTQNKFAKDKFWKINNQRIYDGSLNPFARALIVDNMHKYIISHIPLEYRTLYLKRTNLVRYEFYTVVNHGDISRRSDRLCWKPAIENYKIGWDLNNMSDFWVKVGNDALTLGGVIEDDNVGVIHRTAYSFNMVDHIDKLKLNIIIKY